MWDTLASVMSEAWGELARQLAQVIPNLIASLVVFAIGVNAGVLLGALARRALVAARVDRAAARLGIAEPLGRLGTSPARLIPYAVKWGTIAAAFIPALYTLDPRVASELVGRFLLYLPHLAVAAALLWLGMALSGFLARAVLIAAVNHEMSSPRLLAGATRVGVVLLTVAIALEQLGIGQATVLTAFALLFGGLTLAGALAVGLGSQDLVRAWLAKRLESKRDEPARFEHW